MLKLMAPGFPCWEGSRVAAQQPADPTSPTPPLLWAAFPGVSRLLPSGGDCIRGPQDHHLCSAARPEGGAPASHLAPGPLGISAET